MPISTNSFSSTTTSLGSEENLGTFVTGLIGSVTTDQNGYSKYLFTNIPAPLPANYTAIRSESISIFVENEIEVFRHTTELAASTDPANPIVYAGKFTRIGYEVVLGFVDDSSLYPYQYTNRISTYFFGANLVPGQGFPSALFGEGELVYIYRVNLSGQQILPTVRVLEAIYFGSPVITTVDTVEIGKLDNNHPCYRDLITGYALDNRSIPEKPTIVSTTDKTIKISYYQRNTLEPIPDLASICWRQYTYMLSANKSYTLPIYDCVLGTLYCDDAEIEAIIRGLPSGVNKYTWSDLFADSIDSLFSEWNNLYVNENLNPAGIPLFPKNIILRKIAANNDVWHNAVFGNDINPDPTHPMFVVNDNLSYSRYLESQGIDTATQLDRGIGSLIMDSPRTIEIHKALNAGKYAINELSATADRVTNLGFLVENLARVNGLRFDPNGDIDLAKEKAMYQPRTINKPNLGSPSANGKYNKYSMSCFGEIGMLIPHLPTTYGKNKKELQLFDVVHDIPQMQMAILRQLDVALSIQHGSEIRVNGLNGKVHAYPNQLAVQLECLQRLEKIKYLSERSLLIGTVTGTEVRELFSGIGIPVTQKFLPLKDPLNSKKSFSLPYFGHQKNKPSTAQLLTTVHVNLAVINGVLMPKKQPEKNQVFNPFKSMTPPKK